MRTGPQFTAGPAVTGLGQVEYVLARNSIIREYRRGRLSRLDVCDAQTELLRVANNLGEATDEDCPICEDAKLVHVLFAFGPGLPSSGLPIASQTETKTLARTKPEVDFYVVEVCTSCSWNHMLRQFNASSARRRSPR